MFLTPEVLEKEMSLDIGPNMDAVCEGAVSSKEFADCQQQMSDMAPT